MATYNPKDHFFYKAKKDGFAARSAYKLQDLQQRYRLLQQGDRVLDLGCSPGSWSQVALSLIGPKGHLTGIDLKAVVIRPDPRARFIIGDILTIDPLELGQGFHVVLSDMAPNTSGIRLRDQTLSEELCHMVLKLTDTHLLAHGHMVMKLFEGPGSDELTKVASTKFKKVVRFKPQAVRKGSFETYIVCINKK